MYNVYVSQFLDGFLYIYNFDDVKGGECKLIRAHDLRNPLFGITGNYFGPRSLLTSFKKRNICYFRSKHGL